MDNKKIANTLFKTGATAFFLAVVSFVWALDQNWRNTNIGESNAHIGLDASFVLVIAGVLAYVVGVIIFRRKSKNAMDEKK